MPNYATYFHHLTLYRVLSVAILISALMLICSCDKPTSSKTGTITGKVTLVNDSGNTNNDPVDFAGVTVAVYPLAVLDTTLVRLNTRYPTIGVQITQKTKFDHRLANPIAQGVSLGDGSFSLTGVSEGQYNVVVMKPGWGYRYVCNYTVNAGSNSVPGDSEAGSIFLYPELKISGYQLSGDVVIRNNHHLVVEDNVYFLEGSSLTAKPGAVIRINPSVKMEFMGTLSMQGKADSLITITSNDQIFACGKSTPLTFDRLAVNASSVIAFNSIEYLNMSFSENGFILYKSCDFKSSILQGANGVIAIAGTTENLLQTNVSNCIIQMDKTSPNYCINLSRLSSGVFEKNIILCKYGLYSTASSGLYLADNYVSATHTGVYLNQYVDGVTITHNDFVAGNTAIWTKWGITSTITYNNITAIVGICYNSYLNMGVANNNNLYCSLYTIDFSTNSAYLGHLPAPNNWYNTINDEQVQMQIRDKSDYLPTEAFYDSYSYVDYIPYRTSKQNNAGIIS